METAIKVRRLDVSYSGKKILEDLSFDIYKKEFVSVLGENGCGKTTLLYSLYGFIPNNGGEIKINGKTGFIFQEHLLFPWETILSNLSIAVNGRYTRNEILRISRNSLKETGLYGFREYYPHQLSHGMRQRAAIARSLVYNPEILFMDEPFSSQDYICRLRMRDFILSLKKRRQLTVVLVTHDIDEAVSLSDRIIILSGRPARIKKIIQVKGKKEKIRKQILGILAKSGSENSFYPNALHPEA